MAKRRRPIGFFGKATIPRFNDYQGKLLVNTCTFMASLYVRSRIRRWWIIPQMLSAAFAADDPKQSQAGQGGG